MQLPTSSFAARCSCVALSLLLAFGANATTVLIDPNPDDALIHDIVSIGGGYDATTLYLNATFRAGSLDPDNLGFLFGLDTDLSSDTGVQPPDFFFPLGAEFTIFGLASGGVRNELARVNAVGVGAQVGIVAIAHAIDSFSIAVPLAFLGNDDGVANFGLAVGMPSDLGFAPTDLTIGGPVGTSGPLAGPTSPIPLPGAFGFLGAGILVLLGYGKGYRSISTVSR